MSKYPRSIHVNPQDIEGKIGTHGIPTFIHVNPWSIFSSSNFPEYFHEEEIEKLKKENEKLKKQNELMREALRFYGTGKSVSYRSNDSFEDGHALIAYRKARKVLKKIEELDRSDRK